MNMMPAPMQGAPMPPMPSPEMIEQAKAILEAVTWEEVEPILRTDERRNFNVTVETDSTVFEDAESEKQSRIECVTAITQMLERGVPAIQMNPKLAPLMKELGMFTLGAFKIGRTLEETFEETFDQLGNIEPQPNPEAQKMQMEAEAKKADHAMKQQGQQQDMLFKEKDHQLKLQGQQADLAYKEKELGYKERELALKMREAEENRRLNAENAMFDRQSRQDEMAFKREDSQLTRQAADEDRQFQRSMAEREFAGKDQERQFKMAEGNARFSMDKDEQQARRAMEGEQLKGEGGLSTKQELESKLAEQIGQLAETLSSLQQNDMVIVKALNEIKGNQDEMADAMTRVVGHMTAPRKVSRDPKTGKAIGVEVGKSEGDLKQMLERLTAGGRQVKRDKSGRVEAFG